MLVGNSIVTHIHVHASVSYNKGLSTVLAMGGVTRCVLCVVCCVGAGIGIMVGEEGEGCIHTCSYSFFIYTCISPLTETTMCIATGGPLNRP